MMYRGSGALERGFGAGANFMHGGGRFLMMGGMFLVTALIVVAIVFIIRKARKAHTVDESLQLLNERFAKGELSEEDYKRMKTVLKTK